MPVTEQGSNGRRAARRCRCQRGQVGLEKGPEPISLKATQPLSDRPPTPSEPATDHFDSRHPTLARREPRSGEHYPPPPLHPHKKKRLRAIDRFQIFSVFDQSLLKRMHRKMHGNQGDVASQNEGIGMEGNLIPISLLAA